MFCTGSYGCLLAWLTATGPPVSHTFVWPPPCLTLCLLSSPVLQAQDLRMQSLARMAEAVDEELAASGSAGGPQLVASVAELPSSSGSSQPSAQQQEQGQQQQGWRWTGRGGPFASMSMAAAAPMGWGAGASLSRASHVVLDALSKAAKAVPTRRPRLARPSQRRPARTQQ